MKVLLPLLTGLERDKNFLGSLVSGTDEFILLQVVDKEFLSRAGSAMGEVRQGRIVLDEVKKFFGSKKKKCVELTEWGSTIQKIVSIALIHSVDRVVFVEQKNQFFENILEELKKKKVKYEVVPVVVEVEKKKK